MANIDDTVINQLNEEIKKITNFHQKETSELSPIDSILLKSAESAVTGLLQEVLKGNGVVGGDKFVKVSSLEIKIDNITEILCKTNIKFEVKDNKVIFKYADVNIGDFVIVFELEVVNNWLSCQSYLHGKIVKEENSKDALEILNKYNISTRHSKACLRDDNTILLLRNDNAGFIWDKDNLRDIILMDIVIMLDFYKFNYESLSNFFVTIR